MLRLTYAARSGSTSPRADAEKSHLGGICYGVDRSLEKRQGCSPQWLDKNVAPDRAPKLDPPPQE